MKKILGLSLFALMALGPTTVPVSAQGGGVTPELRAMADRLSTCMVGHASVADRQNVIRWLVLAMAAAPQVKDDVSIVAGAKDDADHKMADLFTRLVTKDCVGEARPLFKSGTKSAFELAFSPLGQVAARDTFSNPATAQAMMSYTKYLDFGELMRVMQ